MLEIREYSGRELCLAVGYEYKKFIKNPKNLMNKLYKISDIEKVGKGRYKVTNLKEIEEDFNINSRVVNKEYSTMNELFKPFIMRKILASSNYSFTGTFDAWLIYSGLVYEEFLKKNKMYLKNNLDNPIDIDFFQKEGKSLYYNFIQCLNALEKKNYIKWYKKRVMVFEYMEQTGYNQQGSPVYEIKRKHITVSEEDERRILDIEAKLNQKYNITDRNDLVYGNKNLNIKRNTFILSKYDEELKRILRDKMGCLFTYTGFQAILKNKYKAKDYIEEFSLDGFNIVEAKNTIAQHRIRKAHLRHKRAIKSIQNELEGNCFGDINTQKDIIINEDIIRKIQYEEDYLENFISRYKEYINKDIDAVVNTLFSNS